MKIMERNYPAAVPNERMVLQALDKVRYTTISSVALSASNRVSEKKNTGKRTHGLYTHINETKQTIQ